MSEMKKKEGFAGMLKLGLILALYAAAACVGLAFVYTGTQKVIAQRSQADLEAALKELFLQSDGFEDITGSIKSPDEKIIFDAEYKILQGNEIIGAAVRTTATSYGGPLTALVGVGIDGKISGVKILEHKDTPGLGANAASPGYFVDKAKGITFYGQFAGKSADDPYEVKRDVAAVTASTITSRAVSSAVKAAGLGAKKWLAAQGGVQ